MTGLQYAITKKAFAVASAFFVCLLFIGLVQAEGKCLFDKQAGSYETVQLDYVVDGDTVWLKDGRKVRILGINTPEVEHEDKPGEPYGDEAKSAAKSFLQGEKQLIMQTSSVKTDNYGRTLGHLFRADGRSLSEYLLSRGLAFQIFNESPNSYTDCFVAAEQQARENNIGVWRLNPVKQVKSDALVSGFIIIQGKIVNISHARKSPFVWLETDGRAVLRIHKDAVSDTWLKQVKNKTIEARGWMVDRAHSKRKLKKGHKRWMLLVYQMDSIKIRP